MNATERAEEILSIYRFYRMDGNLFESEDSERIDDLFDAVVRSIDDCGVLKPLLPQDEFVVPCRGILENDPLWLRRFDHRDTRAFFLSDIYDFLRLFTGPVRLWVN